MLCSVINKINYNSAKTVFKFVLEFKEEADRLSG